MNIGLVEVGSRAIRMVVATQDGHGGLKLLAGTAEPVSQCPDPDEWVKQLAQSVARLRADAARHRPDHVEVFGTELLRRLTPSASSGLLQAIPDIRILTPIEESQACHASACLVARMFNVRGRTVVTADFGNGSFELGAGSHDTPGRLEWHVATQLGAAKLRDLYREGGLPSVASAVRSALKEAPPPPQWGSDVALLISGSAATKLAWLKHRIDAGGAPDLAYSPNLVQGTPLANGLLMQFARDLDRARARDRRTLGDMLNPSDPHGHDPETIISGIQAIQCTMTHVGCSTCHVNAFGTRHGIAWLKLTGTSVLRSPLL